MASAKDIDDLFNYRDKYYSGMSPKNYLEEFGGFQNLPDWLFYDCNNPFFWFFSATQDRETTFYDIADNVKRTYYAWDLYTKFSYWYTKTVSVYNW